MPTESPTESPTQIPLFPLNTVLFPGGPLPLRIFETRYVDMVRHCMRAGSAFGVVLIRGGGEVGELTGTAEIGTSARIVDFSQLPDGLLGISCIGERKFRVLSRSRQPDGLNIGAIEWLEPEDTQPLPPDSEHLSKVLRRILPELGEVYAGIPRHFDDASWVGSRLAEILPLALGDKQYLLELEDPLARIARIAPMIRRADDA